ncbi:stemmadenine O-acetyltransferase-like [Cornus florida]|uniref:stemmadenine O-acetyltransferase-like n=1 Tax=Cornus florida TaxID=4283 RepID=UPI00289BA1BC|nr:stemmadenine O-acetyltransferase-like [Cornus florida]
MKVEVEFISRETIKPSAPTPHHLQNYQLSFLDQISPPVYMPMILFFSADSTTKLTNTEKSDRLKISLSETLTRFYPLAGRLIDNTSIACNDEGVLYTEARAKCGLSQVVTDPNPNEYNKFLPHELDKVDDTLLAIQVTYFNCGGIAVGTCFSHKIADGLSIVMFITSWAATSRAETNIPCPTFDGAKFFPPRNLSGFQPQTGMTKDKIVTKRFVFSNPVVAALRDKYTESSDTENPIRPTRVEALSVFIWSCFVASTRASSGHDERLYTVLHAVNLRTRMDPPLPEYSFGNLYRIAIATPSMEAGDKCRGLVRQMKSTVKSIDGEFVEKLRGGEEHLNFIKERAEKFMKGEVVSFRFTSLCRLPLYEVEFGWGKPVQVGSTRLTFKNLVTFMDTREGDGIEAWINLEEKDMAKFEVNKELLAYVSFSKKRSRVPEACACVIT